jgi:hypothetical protein
MYKVWHLQPLPLPLPIHIYILTSTDHLNTHISLYILFASESNYAIVNRSGSSLAAIRDCNVPLLLRLSSVITMTKNYEFLHVQKVASIQQSPNQLLICVIDCPFHDDYGFSWIHTHFFVTRIHKQLTSSSLNTSTSNTPNPRNTTCSQRKTYTTKKPPPIRHNTIEPAPINQPFPPTVRTVPVAAFDPGTAEAEAEAEMEDTVERTATELLGADEVPVVDRLPDALSDDVDKSTRTVTNRRQWKKQMATYC